jgi:hypothetical protein
MSYIVVPVVTVLGMLGVFGLLDFVPSGAWTIMVVVFVVVWLMAVGATAVESRRR